MTEYRFDDAIAAGVPLNEINKEVSKHVGYRYEDARKAGISDEEINAELRKRYGSKSSSPKQPSEEQPKKGFITELEESFKDFSPIENLQHGMLGNIAEGISNRIIEAQHPAIKQLAEERKQREETVSKDIKSQILDMISYAKEHLGATVGEFLKGVAADPELILAMGIPGVREASSGAKLSQVLGNLAAKFGPVASTVGKVAGRVAQAGAVGEATGAAMSAAQQFSKGDVQVGQALKEGAPMGLLGAVLGGIRYKDFQKVSGLVEKGDMKSAEEWLHDFVGKESPVKAEAVKQVFNKSDAEINAEFKAYELMQKGASKKEVEAVIKKRPLVGEKLDEMMVRRQEVRQGPMKDTLQGEHLSPEQKFQQQIPQKQPALDNKQSGKIDKRLVASIGLASAGAIAAAPMAEKGQRFEAAVLGGTAGLALPFAISKIGNAVGNNLKGATFEAAKLGGFVGGGIALNPDRRVEGALAGTILYGFSALPKSRVIPQTEMFASAYNNQLASARIYGNVANKIKEAIPGPQRRMQVFQNYEKGITTGLSPSEKASVAAWKKITDSFADAAKDSGLMNGFIENYVPHIVEKTTGRSGEEVLQQIRNLLGLDETTGPGGKGFTKARKYKTFEELNKALEGTGLQIKTMDPSEIINIYGRSMSRAIEQKNLIEGLKTAKIGGDDSSASLIATGEKVPHNYVSVPDIPSLNGMKVHPEVVDPLKMLLKSRSTNETVRAVSNVNAAIKRLGVSFSMFHGKSLLEAGLMSGGIKGISPSGIKTALNMFHNGGLGDDIDLLIRKGGLSLEHTTDVDEMAFEKVGKLLDDISGTKLGSKTLKPVDAVQKQLDHITWDILHTGMKANLALKLLNDFRQGKKVMGKDFSHLSEEQALKQISSYVNDSFGGLNWYQVLDESRTAIGRKLSANLLNPKSRDIMQMLMFAPDWTLSTLRAWYKAIPGHSGELNQRLAAQYVARTGLTYLTVLNAINQQTAGHPIWENKDQTRIEFKDGTTMQVMKHTSEAYHALSEPSKFVSNKLGTLVQAEEIMRTGQAYAGGPAVDSKAAAIFSKMSPFSAQAMLGDNIPTSDETRAMRTLAGALGIGYYGVPKEEKQSPEYKEWVKRQYAKKYNKKKKED